MLTIHHLDNSRSERIVWLLEELGLPYQQQTFMRDKGMAPAAMKAVHPLGKAPILSDDDVVIMESGAIVEYIVNRYGKGRLAPAVSSADYPMYLQWRICSRKCGCGAWPAPKAPTPPPCRCWWNATPTRSNTSTACWRKRRIWPAANSAPPTS